MRNRKTPNMHANPLCLLRKPSDKKVVAADLA